MAEAIAERGIDAIYGGNLQETENKIRELAEDFDLILILGAGDVYGVAKNLVR